MPISSTHILEELSGVAILAEKTSGKRSSLGGLLCTAAKWKKVDMGGQLVFPLWFFKY